jgi:type II secretory ATPase GspE/PulE/Tfp pilus assembly ATPase PilB-like protein
MTPAFAILPLAAAEIPEAGGYISIFKLVAMLILVIPWLASCPWVYQDTERVRLPRMGWSALGVGAGALGLLLWLLIPEFLIGMLLYVALAAGGLLAYVLTRNNKVDPEYRVLTANHLSNLMGGKQRAQKRIQQENQVVQRVRIYGKDGGLVQPPEPGQADQATIRGQNITQNLFFDMLFRRASEVEMTPAGQQTAVRYLIDGVVTNRPAMTVGDSEAMIDYIKGIAGLETEQKRKPQEARISIEATEGNPVEIYVKTAGTTSGQGMNLKVVEEAIQTRIEKLGMSDDVLEPLLALAGQPGLIIISGPARSGVTSTLYSLLRKQDAYIKHLVTLEKSSAIDLENVTQHEYGQPEKLDDQLASALRRDPDVVMVDRCRTQQAAETIRDAAETISVYLGERASDTFTALAKWIKINGNDPAAVDNLQAVTCQILIRKLCQACKEPFRPDPSILAKANLPARNIDKFYRPPTKPLTDEKGNPITCPGCQGTGYVGRTAAFELLQVTDEIRQIIRSGATLTKIKSAARKNKMLYLQEQALRKVITGQTSIQEVLRATQGTKTAK